MVILKREENKEKGVAQGGPINKRTACVRKACLRDLPCITRVRLPRSRVTEGTTQVHGPQGEALLVVHATSRVSNVRSTQPAVAWHTGQCVSTGGALGLGSESLG